MSPSSSLRLAIGAETARVQHGKNMDSTAFRGKIDGKARGKKWHKARH
jgi:hypothetical protein